MFLCTSGTVVCSSADHDLVMAVLALLPMLLGWNKW